MRFIIIFLIKNFNEDQGRNGVVSGFTFPYPFSGRLQLMPRGRNFLFPAVKVVALSNCPEN